MSHGTVTKYKAGAETRWRFQFRTETGHQIRRRGFATKSEAEREIERERSKHLGLLDPSSLSVGQYLQRWIDDRDAAGSLRPTSIASYRNMLRPAIERFSTLRLDALTPSHLDALYQDLSTSAGRDGTGRRDEKGSPSLSTGRVPSSTRR